MGEYLQAALKLHEYIVKKHWTGGAIVGPDPIGHIHWRLTRFIRSYFPWLPRDDHYTYIQGQGYWIRANLTLFELTGTSKFLVYSDNCAKNLVQIQPLNGGWEHPPLRERRGFISTVEGVWGSLGLIAAYRKIGKKAYLDSALKWYELQINSIGFQTVEDGLAVNYYSHSSYMAPNVTTMVLSLMAELYEITQNNAYLEYTERLILFLSSSQLDSGELPYVFPTKPHFMCYQYNSFQFLDLALYYEIVKDSRVLPIMYKLARYLSGGLTERGSCRYNCFNENPEVNYWTIALATALYKAHQMGIGEYGVMSLKAFCRGLSRQRPDGGFDFSDRNYKYFHDSRSYPRYLAMILSHLSIRAKTTSSD